MREKFSYVVEKARYTNGYNEYVSERGDKWGMFFFVHPRTGAKLKVIVSDGGDAAPLDSVSIVPWDHVSVSLAKRPPVWDEMCWIKAMFFKPDECVVQYHPRADDYVNFHSHCLHMWRKQDEDFPMPPKKCV